MKTELNTLRRCALHAALLLAVLLALPARAELMLNPTRLVFGPNQRAALVELINNGSEPATYRISLVNRRMSETGEFQTITTPGPGELFADAMLSYSPRQITLQPGTAQVVRVMVRKPHALAPGEYRSHLHFEKMAGPAGASSIEQQGRTEQQIGVVLNTLIGASIPVIVRHNAAPASVTLGGLALQPGAAGQAPLLAFVIERSGDTSVYGDLSVSYLPRAGAEVALTKASGVAVYAPNALRRASLALNAPPGIVLKGGSLRLVFRERVEAGGKVLAEAALALP